MSIILNTTVDMLTAWDRDLTVFSVEMGGLSPGYENVIQVLMIEMVRYMLEDPPPFAEIFEEQKEIRRKGIEKSNRIWEEYRHKMDRACTVSTVLNILNPSGAQYGAASNLACLFVRNGYIKTLNSVPEKRHIMISKTHLPKREEVTHNDVSNSTH